MSKSRTYAQLNEDQDEIVRIEFRSHPRPNSIVIPDGEQKEWLVIVDALDPVSGEPIGKAIEVDEALKASIQAAEADAKAWADLRAQRDALLTATDPTQLPDHPADSAAYAIYRQALRDLPANTVDPSNPTWPEEPGS